MNLAALRDGELVKLQLHTNDWFVRHARRILQERAVAGKLEPGTHAALQKIVRENKDVTRRLRAMWALHVTDGLNAPEIPTSDPRFQKRPQDLSHRLNPMVRPSLLFELLRDADENIRWWAVQLLSEDRKPQPAALREFARLAREDKSPMVRLSLASALQRLALAQRWEIAESLLAHEEDSADQNLPLMLWYAIEPLVPTARPRAIQLAARAKIPVVRQLITRRVAEQ